MGVLSSAVRSLVAREAKQLPIGASIPTWESGADLYPSHTQSYQRLAQHGYAADEVVYAAIDFICTSAAEPPLAAYKRKGNSEEKLEDHPSLDLFRNPNPFMSGEDLWESLIMHRYLGGNAYMEKVRSRAGKVVEVWLLRPDRIRIIPDEQTFIRGYHYIIGDKDGTLPPEDVVHFKTRHPMDDFYGLPALAVSAGRIDLDTWSRQFSEAWFRNAGVPAGLLNIMRSVSDQERELIRQRFRQEYGGPHGWHNMLIVDQGEATYTKMGAGANDGNITDSLDEINEARLSMVLGLPPSIISTRIGMKSASYANRVSDVGLFWRGTLIPILRSIGGTLTMGLKDEYPDVDRWGFDVSKIQALQEDDDKKHARLREDMVAGGITWEEFRLAAGYPEQPDKVGTLFVSTRSVPTPSDMLQNLAPTPGLPPKLQATQEQEQVSRVQDQPLSEQQQAELLPGEGKSESKAGNEQALLDYWRGRMGQGGDFDECVSALSGKPNIDNPEALCAWLHHEATGEWPGHAPGESRDKALTNGRTNGKH